MPVINLIKYYINRLLYCTVYSSVHSHNSSCDYFFTVTVLAFTSLHVCALVAKVGADAHTAYLCVSPLNSGNSMVNVLRSILLCLF